MKHTLPNKSKQSGFTLLESLLALFVLTIGILGVAGLQIQSMKAGNVAKQRMIAVSYTEELLERIRANPAGVASYLDAAESFGCSSGSVCNAAEMAADDLYVWTASVEKAMPGTPEVTVTVDSISDAVADPADIGRNINIVISWDNRGDTYTFESTAVINIVANFGG